MRFTGARYDSGQIEEAIMTDAALPAGRFSHGDLRIGPVLSRAWSVLSGNFLKFSVFSGIAVLPWLLLPQPSGADADNPFANLRLVLFVTSLAIVLNMLSQAIVFYGTLQDMRRRQVSLAEGLKIGLRRFFPLVGLVGVVILPLLALALMVVVVVGIVPDLIYASPVIAIPVGMLLLIWSMGTPVCVVERLGPFRSLSRSRALTKGHLWKILGLLLVTVIPGVIVGLILGAAMGIAGVLSPGSGLSAALQAITLLWNAIWSAYFAVAFAVAYHDLRSDRGGVRIEQVKGPGMPIATPSRWCLRDPAQMSQETRTAGLRSALGGA
jgi:hypothetical protein